jgi:hypothetical protein
MKRYEQPTPDALARQIEQTIAALSPHATNMRKLAQRVRTGKISHAECERLVAKTLEQLSRIC